MHNSVEQVLILTLLDSAIETAAVTAVTAVNAVNEFAIIKRDTYFMIDNNNELMQLTDGDVLELQGTKLRISLIEKSVPPASASVQTQAQANELTHLDEVWPEGRKRQLVSSATDDSFSHHLDSSFIKQSVSSNPLAFLEVNSQPPTLENHYSFPPASHELDDCSSLAIEESAAAAYPLLEGQSTSLGQYSIIENLRAFKERLIG